mmetsp:Transcript_12534/g.24067  ORF Transcript_12534/g.24067 Transcript_12534/m.24067 type:complete len:277 (+) Transcript_12534:44-874(+)
MPPRGSIREKTRLFSSLNAGEDEVAAKRNRKAPSQLQQFQRDSLVPRERRKRGTKLERLKKAQAAAQKELDGSEPDEDIASALGSSAVPTPQKSRKISVARAPVLILWVAVVVSRQRYSFCEGLSFGSWFVQILAEHTHKAVEPVKVAERVARATVLPEGGTTVKVFGMRVPVVHGSGRLGATRAIKDGDTIDPAITQKYLTQSFGGEVHLQQAKQHLEQLADAMLRWADGDTSKVDEMYYTLYEQFRPDWYGVGNKGELDLAVLKDLASKFVVCE